MHVVIVDPSRVVQQKLALELDASGCYVDCFSHSDLAMGYIENTPTVDVVLTSLEIEPIPGLELCWKLRTFVGEKRPLHVIVMSSNTSERALAEALDCGADDFIVKPIRQEELAARLRAANRMITLQRQLVEQASTDYLTGALNRRAYMAIVEEKRRQLDPEDSLSLALLDIDRFKVINDTHGHDVGDLVIEAVAKIAAEEAPIVARLGGEEYALAFPILGAVEAAHWCETIRRNISEHAFTGTNGPFHITCSFGVSEWPASESLRHALKQADRALMQAKTRGRNQVVTAEPVSGMHMSAA
jgi:two-component system, cell cycle response regulator